MLQQNKRVHKAPAMEEATALKRQKVDDTIIIQFVDALGNPFGQHVQVLKSLSKDDLNQLLKTFKETEVKDGDDEVVDQHENYSFFVDQHEISKNIQEAIEALPDSLEEMSSELVIPVTFRPESLFRVRAVTRCSSTLPGHTDSILSIQFSPDGKFVASGSGDHTVRIWEVNTELPKCTLRGHKDWILAMAWSPDGKKLATGSKDMQIRIWVPEEAKQMPKKPLRGHTRWITSIDWQPYHSNPKCDRLVSGSKDGTVRVWDAIFGNTVMSFSGHSACVTSVRWGANGLIYSASEDKTIKVWNAENGKLVRSLDGHGHWVNSIALSTEYVLRTGAFKQNGMLPEGDLQEAANKKVQQALATTGGKEILLSCSDDLTCYLWEPEHSKKPLTRLIGHQRPINVVKFSPDSTMIATASFDNSVKLWSCKGEFLATLRSHVQAVYQVAFSSDSRLLLSGSRDSTMKVWDVRANAKSKGKDAKPQSDLPGHADEVYAVDWSPDGIHVASGGKDRVLKFWRR
jgi:ribosome assembly protein 4